jgi:hypothetical protein
MIRGCPSSFDLILKSWEFHQHQYTHLLSLSCCCGDIRCVEMRAHIFHQRLSHGLNAMIGSPQALTHCALLLKKHTPKTWPCMLGSMVSCSHFIFCHLHLVSELLTFIYFGYTHSSIVKCCPRVFDRFPCCWYYYCLYCLLQRLHINVYGLS